MVDVWGSIKSTAESLGGMAYAPVGAVVDIAQMPFDDKSDDFGSIIHALASRGGDALDPVFNPQTLTGAAIGKTLAGMNWAWREGVSEPVATANMVSRHTFGGLANLGPVGIAASLASGQADVGELFDADTWAAAYERANQQQNALGAAFAYGAMNPNSDPLAVDNPYAAAQSQNKVLANSLGWSGELAASFLLDPTALAGKGAGALRRTSLQIPGMATFAKLAPEQKARLLDEITSSSKGGLLRETLQSRTDKYLDWIGGQNKLGRPLLGPEILHGTPELKRYAADPHVIAGLLADANSITNPIARRDAQRRILAVAAGDVAQIGRLKTEAREAATIADALSNMTNGSVVDLRALAMSPMLRTNPMFVQRLDQQVKNLNDAGDLERFMVDWNTRLDQMLETQHTMTHLPAVHTAGKRAILRQNETGKLRAADNAARKLDDWAAKRATEARSASSVFQKGLYNIPVVAVKTVGLMASPYTKVPVAVSDGLRQTHFTGLANLHDWGAASTQLDSMMRLAKVSPADRMKVLSETFLAKTEPEKLRAIDLAEQTSLLAMSREFSARAGREVNEDYIRTLLTEHATKRNQSRAMMQGRAYAATQQTPDMLRANSAGRAEDAARLDAGREAGAATAPDRAGNWRVDQINDDGTPLSLPLLETQLSNTVPLMDMDIARTLLKRDTGYLSRLSKAWEDDSKELQRLADLKRAGHQGLDKALAAKAASVDWLVNAGQIFMRAWKFNVLFRLGYPVRVLMDDHFRIWSQMNAGAFYGENGGEVIANWRNNAFGRRSQGKEALHALRVRRQEIVEELDGDRMAAHLDRQAELRSVQASLRGRQASIAKLRTQVEEAETKRSLGIDPGVDLTVLRAKLKDAEKTVAEKEGAQAYLIEQLGDYGPDALKLELESIDELIAGGWKGLADPKRRLGEAPVVLDNANDVSIEGSMGGAYGNVWRAGSSSAESFDNQLRGVEDRMYKAMAGGSHRTVGPTEPGHLYAWADVLNNQIRTSPVAMHFVNGGDVPSFVRWVRSPEQADLRKRLAHFAHDPEDWGHRVQALIHDYIPSDDLRQAVIAGRVKPARLGKMFSDPTMRPAVHGRSVADNIGSSFAVQSISNGLNRIMRMLGEMPTDRLSRHPFFNSLYKRHAKEIYSTRRAGLGADYKYTQADLDEIALQARKLALHDLRQTLFDVSAHSHAAHVMRFVSPFFAAHQEGVARWWRIASDNPAVIRRYLQAFDVPRYLGIEVDLDGNPVKPGSPISREHRILLQLPKAFGGDDPDIKQARWSVSESAFNLILQGGLTNPGVGPVVSVPMEWAVSKYANDTELARVARVFNPFPPNSPFEGVMAAWTKRLSAYTYAKTGFDPSLMGIGKREYNQAFSQHVQDLMVDFQLKNGREPTSNEAASIVERAGREASTQMFHRLLWNSLSPAPATPQSKYAAIQQGWYKIADQAKAEGRDFDWAYAQFKERYGEAYMPLVYSTSNNPAWVDANPASVAALKHYRGILKKVDPALTRMVIGAYADEMVEKNLTLAGVDPKDAAAVAKYNATHDTIGEYSPEARNWLRDQRIKPGSSETYYSYDEPAQAMDEQMARRGWVKYGELTGALTAQAQQMGLTSYEESDQLMAIKRAAIAQLKAENYAFAKDYDTVDSGQYDRYLADMRDLVASPVLANDTERTDIQTLKTYLELRDLFSAIFEQRQAQGLGGVEAQANDGVRAAYTALVHKLVESNTYFETNIYNGVVERDPWLIEPAA